MGEGKKELYQVGLGTIKYVWVMAVDVHEATEKAEYLVSKMDADEKTKLMGKIKCMFGAMVHRESLCGKPTIILREVAP